jgi:flagellar biosynthesis component FlhA
MGRLFSTLSPQAIALPVGILTIIVLMVMPIPAFMLDAFFVFNIAMSVAVLMASMNAAKPSTSPPSLGAAVCHAAASGAQCRLHPRRAGARA